MGRLVTIASILGFVLLPGLAQANGIASVAYNGTGCPQGTAGFSISNDRSTMTLIFEVFVATTGPSVPSSEMDKHCNIDVTMQTSDSAGINIQSRGYVQLDRDIVGEEDQHIPQAKGSDASLSFTGPTAKDYVSASAATVLAQGKPGNTTFRVSLSVELDNALNPSRAGQMTVDSFDLQIVP